MDHYFVVGKEEKKIMKKVRERVAEDKASRKKLDAREREIEKAGLFPLEYQLKYFKRLGYPATIRDKLRAKKYDKQLACIGDPDYLAEQKGSLFLGDLFEILRKEEKKEEENQEERISKRDLGVQTRGDYLREQRKWIRVYNRLQKARSYYGLSEERIIALNAPVALQDLSTKHAAGIRLLMLVLSKEEGREYWTTKIGVGEEGRIGLRIEGKNYPMYKEGLENPTEVIDSLAEERVKDYIEKERKEEKKGGIISKEEEEYIQEEIWGYEELWYRDLVLEILLVPAEARSISQEQVIKKGYMDLMNRAKKRENKQTRVGKAYQKILALKGVDLREEEQRVLEKVELTGEVTEKESSYIEEIYSRKIEEKGPRLKEGIGKRRIDGILEGIEEGTELRHLDIEKEAEKELIKLQNDPRYGRLSQGTRDKIKSILYIRTYKASHMQEIRQEWKEVLEW